MAPGDPEEGKEAGPWQSRGSVCRMGRACPWAEVTVRLNQGTRGSSRPALGTGSGREPWVWGSLPLWPEVEFLF